jgi:lipopolysaccharide/colanic/teichoic acid biosynthesis glycosyltransferase
VKRFIDIVASLAGLCAFAVPILVLIVVVRATSPGPGILRQSRVGRNAVPFVCFKLRTMYIDTQMAATHEVSRSQVTPIGAFLRRYKLDELPQLWNVLRGDMSLVGPRPCLPVQHELIQARSEQRVFDVRPGITGLAQVQGVDMSDPERLAHLDAEGIAQHSVAGDLKLIWMTISGRGRGDRTAS